MAGWDEILKDRTRYPDTMTVKIGDGDVALGDLRNGVVPKGDMTKLTQQAAQQKQALEGQVRTLGQQLAAAMKTGGTEPGNIGTGTMDEDDLTPYINDPTFGPMARKLQRVLDGQKQIAERQANSERSAWMNHHMGTLADIRKSDPNVDVQALLGFASQRGLPNLKDAYDLMTRDSQIEKVRQDAEKVGFEKARAEAPPHIPLGTRRAPALADTAPKTFDDAEAAALSDPEISAIMAGQNAG